MDLSAPLDVLSRYRPLLLAGDSTRHDAMAELLCGPCEPPFWGRAAQAAPDAWMPLWAILPASAPAPLVAGPAQVVRPEELGVTFRDSLLGGLRRNFAGLVATDLPDGDARVLWCDALNTGGNVMLAALGAGSAEEAYGLFDEAMRTRGWGDSGIREKLSVCVLQHGRVVETVLAANWEERTAGL